MEANSNQSVALGRLWALLKKFEVGRARGVSVRAAWASALDVPEEAVGLELAIVASQLLPAAEQQALSSANDFVAEAWETHGQAWSAPLLHETLDLDQAAGNISTGDLTVLALVWSNQVNAGEVEGPSPRGELIEDWIQKLAALRGQVQEDESLEPRFRVAIIRHIDNLIWALDHFQRTGPEGVQDAVARLLGSLVFHQATTTKAKTKKTHPHLATLALIAVGIANVVTGYSDFREGAIAIHGDVTTAAHAVEAVAEEWSERDVDGDASASGPAADHEQDDDDEQDSPSS